MGQPGIYACMTLAHCLNFCYSQRRQRENSPVPLTHFRHVWYNEMNLQSLKQDLSLSVPQSDRGTNDLDPQLYRLQWFFSWCPSVKVTAELNPVWERKAHLYMAWVFFYFEFCLAVLRIDQYWRSQIESGNFGNIQVSERISIREFTIQIVWMEII